MNKHHIEKPFLVHPIYHFVNKTINSLSKYRILILVPIHTQTILITWITLINSPLYTIYPSYQSRRNCFTDSLGFQMTSEIVFQSVLQPFLKLRVSRIFLERHWAPIDYLDFPPENNEHERRRRRKKETEKVRARKEGSFESSGSLFRAGNEASLAAIVILSRQSVTRFIFFSVFFLSSSVFLFLVSCLFLYACFVVCCT